MSTFNSNLPSMSYARAYFSAVTHRRRIFVMGGAGAVEMFDIDTQQWSTIPSMSTTHPIIAAVMIGDNIIVIGRLTAAQYNLVSKQWSPLPSMNTVRYAFAAAVVDGKIVVVGGYGTDGEYFANVEEYNPITEEWREIAPMHIKRGECATAVLDGKLYVMGGYDDSQDDVLSSAEVYDPTTQRWTLLNDMTTPRSGCAAVPLEGRIVVVGGYDGRAYLPSCEAYDPETQKWSRVASMHYKRVACAAVEVEGDIYVLGGEDEDLSLLSSMECLPSSAFFAFLLDDKPDLAKDLGIDDNAMPAFLSLIGRKCRMLTLWEVIRNRQDLLNLMPVVSTDEMRAQKRARH